MHDLKNMNSGLYLVTLLNDDPIAVNSRDRRIADRVIMVNRFNCKLGRALDFARRKRNYDHTFGAEYVNFLPYAVTKDIQNAEKIVLKKVHEYRVRGRTGRLNEWLVGIDPKYALQLAVTALNESSIEYELCSGIG